MSLFSYWALVFICAAAVVFGGPLIVVSRELTPLQSYWVAVLAMAVLILIAMWLDAKP